MFERNIESLSVLMIIFKLDYKGIKEAPKTGLKEKICSFKYKPEVEGLKVLKHKYG